MVNCPDCGVPTERRSGHGGLIWSCPSCSGASSMISTLRKTIPRDVVNSLWNAAKSGRYPQKRPCPACSHRMAEVPVGGDHFAVDICPACAFVWFDAGEYQQLPSQPEEAPREVEKLSPELVEREALHKMEHIRQRARRTKVSPDEAWKYIPALLGVPVEFDVESVRCRPVVTWALLVIVSFVSLLGFAGVLTSSEWGLIPAHWGRLGGLTLLTSFFLHGGLGHLAGNLYFLFVFGDNVEDFLGRTRFLTLLVASTVVGGLFYIIAHEGSMTPCIGASGGVSGILAYYALRFPKHRLGFLLFFCKWIRFPVIAYLGFWVVMQLIGAVSGVGRVAYMAHIGGLLTGVVFWAAERFARPIR